MMEYETPDLYLASFLKCHHCFLKDVKQKGPQFYFILEGENVPYLVRSFYNNGEVKVLNFTGNMRDLRNIIKNGGLFK